MPLLKKIDSLDKFIPPINKVITNIGLYSRAQERIVKFFPLYAIYVNKKGVTEKTFEVRITGFSTEYTAYLLFESLKGITKTHLFISKPISEIKRNSANPWGFEVDDIGLHINLNTRAGGKIYFGNSFLDVAEVRGKMTKIQEKRIVTAEVVYV